MTIYDIRPPDWNWREWFKKMNKYTTTNLSGDIGWYGRKKESPLVLLGVVIFVFAVIIFGWAVLQ